MRYDGGDCVRHLDDEAQKLVQRWNKQGLLLPLCPEVAGGLSIPRPPAEIVGDKVQTQVGHDVSIAFERGAEEALRLCTQYSIQFAILKQGSPSCGSKQIYDGSFTKRKIKGQGKTAKLLQQHGVQVFDEHDLSQLLDVL